jgi:PhnB protein
MTVTEMKSPYVGVIPYICVSDARAASKLYEKALGAKVIDTRTMKEGDPRLIHCEMVINGNAMMINDPFPEHGMAETGAGSCVLHITVDDLQAWWDRAIAAGFKPEMEPHDAFWGDRYAVMSDAYGLRWALVGPKK